MLEEMAMVIVVHDHGYIGLGDGAVMVTLQVCEFGARLEPIPSNLSDWVEWQTSEEALCIVYHQYCYIRY